MKHIVCFSGGHSSAIVAIEVVRKFGKENVVLLNHNISSWTESEDIKRFKQEVADYLGVNITFANYEGEQDDNLIKDQFDVSIKHSAFKLGNGNTICTARLKTEPFMEYLNTNFPEKDCVVYYGFDYTEVKRIQRRSSIMSELGYRTDFPLALWKDRTIYETSEIGIERPNTYSKFKHANCIGCIKGGKLHWYIVYCTRPDIWEKAKQAEDEIGHHIIRGIWLDEIEPLYRDMKNAGVIPNEHVVQQTFWVDAKKKVDNYRKFDIIKEEDYGEDKPCECSD